MFGVGFAIAACIAFKVFMGPPGSAATEQRAYFDAVTPWFLVDALLSAASVIGLRYVLGPARTSLRASCLALAAWIFFFCFGLFAFEFAGYPPRSIGEACISDVLLFPYVVALAGGLVATLTIAYFFNRSASAKPRKALSGLKIRFATLGSSVLAMFAALVISQLGFETILLAPLESDRILHAESKLRVGMPKAALCMMEPFTGACRISYAFPMKDDEISLQYFTFVVFCYNAGHELVVRMDRSAKVSSWLLRPTSQGC